MRNTLSYWLPSHRRYKKFCSLAAAGQLGGPEMFELNTHVGSCPSCREFLASINQVTVQALPLLAVNRIHEAEIDPPPGMRARFLERLAEEQANPPEMLVFERALPTVTEKRTALSRTFDSSARRIFSWRALVVAVSASALLGVSGFYIGRQNPRSQTGTSVSRPSTDVAASVSDDTDRMRELERQKASLEGELALVRRQLASSASERDSLRQQLTEASERVSKQRQVPIETSENSNEDQQMKVQVALLESDVDRLKRKLRDSEEQLATQQQMTLQVSEKLQLTEANLGRERDLKSAKDEMGDLVGSRNLHIVDVYDADSSGKQQPAFGRVFYVQDKSLVFYAYDLDRPRQFKANVVFHVWGGKAGVKEVTHSLGILHKDDAGQDRWAMTFDDPKVLSQINSVFVTAEVSSKSYDSPHGRKVLYAYFGGQPNHP